MFTLVINYILLVSYRVVLMNVTKHGALDVRHVAVIGNGPAALRLRPDDREPSCLGIEADRGVSPATRSVVCWRAEEWTS